MNTSPKSSHERYVSKFLEAVGCTAEAYDALDWSDLAAVRKKLHPKVVPRVTRLVAQTEIEKNPPGIALAWWSLANSEYELGDVTKAIELCRRGIEINTGRAGVRDLRSLLVRLERERDAQERSNK